MNDGYTKLVVLLKKKPGMSFEEFQNYYETTHCKFIRLIPRVQCYFRRYLHPLTTHPGHADDDSTEYHVITELWFNSREDLEYAMRRNAEPAVLDVLVPDEEKLFDRSKTRVHIVEKHYSDLTKDVPAAD
jgi:uncharacterized protein (TIGR02118 family)